MDPGSNDQQGMPVELDGETRELASGTGQEEGEHARAASGKPRWGST